MADQIGTTAQGATSASAQGAETNAASVAATTTQPVEEAFDKERALETIRKQRASEEALAKENRRLAKIVEEHEAAEKRRREADLSEGEKLKAQLAELADRHAKADAELRDLKLRQAIRQAAGKAKVLWASEVAELDAIEILARGATLDDSGNPKGLDEQIKALQKEREYLFRKGTPPPNINADANSKGNPSAEERVKALRQRFPSIKS